MPCQSNAQKYFKLQPAEWLSNMCSLLSQQHLNEYTLCVILQHWSAYKCLIRLFASETAHKTGLVDVLFDVNGHSWIMPYICIQGLIDECAHQHQWLPTPSCIEITICANACLIRLTQRPNLQRSLLTTATSAKLFIIASCLCTIYYTMFGTIYPSNVHVVIIMVPMMHSSSNSGSCPGLQTRERIQKATR